MLLPRVRLRRELGFLAGEDGWQGHLLDCGGRFIPLVGEPLELADNRRVRHPSRVRTKGTFDTPSPLVLGVDHGGPNRADAFVEFRLYLRCLAERVEIQTAKVEI